MITMIPKPKEESGFSLTELVVVLFGGMILLTIAVPALDTTLDQYRVVLAAQSVVNQLLTSIDADGHLVVFDRTKDVMTLMMEPNLPPST
jgi:competence protein ComGC